MGRSPVTEVRCSAVIIDFAQVTSMDSTSFVELEMAAKMLQQQQVTLTFGAEICGNDNQ
jgi:anti-anti-sigma regulatory factor